jgi:hemoglobin-like flavoprotein
MLDITVNMLGPDLEPVTMALEELGARHVHYGVIPDHYPIVGEALLATLEAALGEAWTPTVKAGWSGIYTFVSTTMMKGARESVREEKEDCLDAKGVERLTVGVQEQ